VRARVDSLKQGKGAGVRNVQGQKTCCESRRTVLKKQKRMPEGEVRGRSRGGYVKKTKRGEKKADAENNVCCYLTHSIALRNRLTPISSSIFRYRAPLAVRYHVLVKRNPPEARGSFTTPHNVLEGQVPTTQLKKWVQNHHLENVCQ